MSPPRDQGQTGQESNRPGMPGWPSRGGAASWHRPPSDANTMSLAGPPQQPPSHDLHNTSYEPGYRQADPWVEKWEQQGGAEFRLAGTFPHKNRFKGEPQDPTKNQRDPRRGNASTSHVDGEGKGEAEAWGATITGSLVGGPVYDMCIFRGNESPVNFSRRRLKYEGRKAECVWLKWFRQGKKAKNVERGVEDGFAAPGSDEEMGRR